MLADPMSLQLNHHSAVEDDVVTHSVPRVFTSYARQTGGVAVVVPPTSTAYCSTVGSGIGNSTVIVVMVDRRKLHAVVVVFAKLSITSLITLILERVTGVSAVSGQLQSIFIVELITDLE